jgi:hypothetical protein
MRRVVFGVTSNRLLSLLAFAAWLLLGVSWVMSVYAYPKLPEQAALWTTLWRAQPDWESKSAVFFIYPVAQTVFFLAFLAWARKVFFRSAGRSPGAASAGKERAWLLSLKKEVAYLGLIFLNLVFIHLQTSLILISHGLAQGINRFYFAMLLVVLLMLVPYYRVRRQIIRAASAHEK